MFTPAESRAELYMPRVDINRRQYAHMIQMMIGKYHLNAPYPVQYYYWVTNLLQETGV
jgi:ABC-type dipeptide/oligopeptide/nickel transport system permease component